MIHTHVIARITPADADQLVYLNHYAGGLSPAAVCYGLRRWLDKQLVGVAAFLAPVSEAARRKPLGAEGAHLVWDLHRLVLLDHDDEPHLTSWFLTRAARGLYAEFGARVVMTYADPTEGHTGAIYRACNALYLGKTRPAVAYQDAAGCLHATRRNGRNISRAEAEAEGWTVVRRKPKHRYALIVGDGHPSRRKLRQQVLRAYGLGPKP